MTKQLMEYILGKRVTFNSGDRPTTIGSNRHHTKSSVSGKIASYAFDLRVSSNLEKKAKVAAAWKFAAQTFGYTASVGMRYGNSSSMVHVDTVGHFGGRTWGKSRVSRNGRIVLGYYSDREDENKGKNKKMPCQILAKILGTSHIKCIGGEGLLANNRVLKENQPYQSTEAKKYAQNHGVDTKTGTDTEQSQLNQSVSNNIYTPPAERPLGTPYYALSPQPIYQAAWVPPTYFSTQNTEAAEGETIIRKVIIYYYNPIPNSRINSFVPKKTLDTQKNATVLELTPSTNRPGLLGV